MPLYFRYIYVIFIALLSIFWLVGCVAKQDTPAIVTQQVYVPVPCKVPDVNYTLPREPTDMVPALVKIISEYKKAADVCRYDDNTTNLF